MEDYVSFEQAVRLKELGFDWKCNHYYDTQTKEFLPVDWFDYDGDVDADDLYDNNPPKDIISYRVSAPTLAQAQKWLRDVKKILILIDILRKNEKIFYWKIFNSETFWIYSSDPDFDTYEQALSAGIDKALQILREE